MPSHVAIIMDGNGRWATARGYPRESGHREGAKAVRRIVTAALRAQIETLTLYAFSSDNWQRPQPEVRRLMHLFHRYLAEECRTCVDNGVRLEVAGRRDRLSPRLRDAIRSAEAATADGHALRLRIAIDYSGRAAILRAVDSLRGGADMDFGMALARACHVQDAVDVDLLIRAGGEKRLSDFLLWESAYAEIVFSERLWPDFAAEDLDGALAEFRRRQRRFGALPGAERPPRTFSEVARV